MFNRETKESILTSITRNKEMLLQLSVLSANVNESVGMAVLLMITDLSHHVGFFVLQFCLELYKQNHKRLIQMSKVLRKQIATHTNYLSSDTYM